MLTRPAEGIAPEIKTAILPQAHAAAHSRFAEKVAV